MKYDENVNVFLRINKAAITFRFVWYVTLFLQEQESNFVLDFSNLCNVYVGSISESFVPIYILILPMYDCTWIHKPPVTSLKSILLQKLY